MREEQLQQGQLRTCGCVHRYQPATKQRTVVVRQRSQSATPLRSPQSSSQVHSAHSRPTTPTAAAQHSRLTNGSRSRSEPHLGDETGAPGRAGTPDSSGRSSRATHWSRRTPEDLARLARLRSTSRSPVSFRGNDAPPSPASPGPRQGGRPPAATRVADVGTGYGHSYSLPRPFDTTPTGRASRTPPQQQHHPGGKFERSRAPSQSGASYYRSRGRSGAVGSCTAGCHTVSRTVSRTMSESSLVVEWEEEEEEDLELEPRVNHGVNGHREQPVNGHREQPRYVTECRMEPRCQPAGFSSTVLCRRDSTWRRFVEEVRFQKCLVPATAVKPSPATAPVTAPVAAPVMAPAPPTSAPPPPPPRRYRTELDVWVSSPATRPDGRQPIVLPVAATA